MRSLKTRRRVSFLAPLAAVSVLLLAACSSAGPDSPVASGDPAAKITVASQYPVVTLDPHGPDGAAAATQLSSQAIFSRLTRTLADGSIVGDLAAEWKSNSEGTEWTFTLREGVKFADGTPLTAVDVAASLQRLRDGGSPLASSFDGLEIIGEGSDVVIVTPKPDPALPGKLTLMYVVPAGSSAVGGDGKELVASGPYTVQNFLSGSELSLVPNDEYWGERAENGGVSVVNIPEMSTRLTALQTGEVDLTWGFPDDQAVAVRSNSDLKVEAVPSTLVYTMWFNSSTPALAKPEVRRAIWQAVDFETIITALYPESGELSLAPLPPSTLGYAKQDAVIYDPDAAVRALKAADFDFEGTPLRLHFANAAFRPFLQAVVSDLTDAGIPVELLEKEQAVFTEDLLAMKWDINFQQLSNPTFDAATNLGRLYTCAAGRTGYCNPALDELLNSAGTTVNSEERLGLYSEATKIIWDEAVGMYPMLVKIPYAWSSSLSGVVPDPSGVPNFAPMAKSSN